MTANRIICGITGTAGSGKSLVANILRGQGYHVTDLDSIGHKALRLTEVITAVIEEFGSSVTSKEGGINRKKLGDLVFRDQEKLSRLCAISWPAMHRLVREEFQGLSPGVPEPVFLDAAVLFQGEFDRYCRASIWVEADQEIIFQRLSQRIGTRRARSLIGSQQGFNHYRDKCDIIINNSGTREELEKEVMLIPEHLKKLI